MSANKPSRGFFVSQAVLNAMGSKGISRRFLAFLTNDAKVLPGWLEVAVCREFRKLDEAWS